MSKTKFGLALLYSVLVTSSGIAAAPAASPNVFGEVFVVEALDQIATLAMGGTVVPFKEVTLSAQLPGRIKSLAGIEGDSFDNGSVLVEIDVSELAAKRSAAYAQLAAADAQLRNAGVQYSRELWSPQSKQTIGGMGVPNLFDQMFTGPAEGMMGNRDRGAERSADLYASSTRIEQARSAMLSAQSEIQGIDSKLRDAKSLAPFNGIITHKYIEIGDTVQPGQPMLQFADVTWLQVEIDVPARLISGLKEMMVLESAASFDDHPEAVDVRVAQIYPMADARRHTIKVKFDIPQNVSQPGMYAKISIPDVSAQAFTGYLPTIPTTAIRYRGSLPVVYVQNPEGQAELRLVREGKHLANGMTIVLSGLAAGDKVFTNPGPDILSRLLK